MTSILVTGATGFVGKHLIPTISALGHDVTGVNAQSGDIAAASTWLKFPRVEVLIHLAAKSFVPASWNNPQEVMSCNVLGVAAALDYCKRNNARLIFLSSYLYGNSPSLPIPEDAPLIANNPYALSKKLAEEVCHFYSDKFGTNVTILRPFNVFGPGQGEHFLIPSIVRQVKAGHIIQLRDLEPRRDYIYINDLVDIIVRAIKLQRGETILNVGSGASHSVRELVQLIQDITHTKLEVHSSDERRKDEVMNTVADITRAHQLLGWRPRWTLTQGLRKIILEGKSLDAVFDAPTKGTA